jgi:hypothetical protein
MPTGWLTQARWSVMGGSRRVNEGQQRAGASPSDSLDLQAAPPMGLWPLRALPRR